MLIICRIVKCGYKLLCHFVTVSYFDVPTGTYVPGDLKSMPEDLVFVLKKQKAQIA